MKNRLAVSTLLLLALMFLGSATNVLAQGPWHVIPTGVPFDQVDFWITQTDQNGLVKFTIQIVTPGPHYGMGIIISTNPSTIDFQVFYADWLPAPNNIWYYQAYTPGWAGPTVPLPTLGITATGDSTTQIFTVTIPVSLLGGYSATFYFAVQARTNLIGTFPQVIDGALWSQTDATLFQETQTPPPPVGGEWVPINTVQMLVQVVGSAAVMSAIVASFVGFKRIKRKQN